MVNQRIIHALKHCRHTSSSCRPLEPAIHVLTVNWYTSIFNLGNAVLILCIEQSVRPALFRRCDNKSMLDSKYIPNKTSQSMRNGYVTLPSLGNAEQ